MKRKQKYRSLFHRSIDPIFLASPDLVLIDVNESFLSLLNYETITEAPVALRSLFELEDEYINFEKSLKESGQSKNLEVSLLTQSGERKSCLLNCVFISDATPELCCYQGIIHDLTQRKQAESDLLSAERLSLTGKIARTIAHELRNPLTNLTLALDQLRTELPADNESIHVYGSIIERNINRIEQLVEEMLNTSKSRQLHLEYTPVNEIIEDTLSLAKDRIMLNQIEIQTNVLENLPALSVDKVKIQLALLNIIINAIEAMVPGKGILSIKAFKENENVIISITDNGKGVPHADLDKLFDPFFTAKNSGMGLGLTTVKNILTSHNTHIEVQSAVNEGTTFTLRFKSS